MTQCLFGEHLLTRYPERIVALVEAEKTAVIGAGFIPECKYNREIARTVVEHLQLRANKLSTQIGHPIQETIIISIHVDGAGNGLRPFLISTKNAIFEFLFH